MNEKKASPPTPLQGERGVISLVILWSGVNDGTFNSGVFHSLK